VPEADFVLLDVYLETGVLFFGVLTFLLSLAAMYLRFYFRFMETWESDDCQQSATLEGS
jgi:hypothetical protein